MAAPASRRVAYHALTGIPVRVDEPDVDSDDEAAACAPASMQHSAAAVAALRGVPPADRMFMTLWTRFVGERPVRADALVGPACLEFARRHAAELAGDEGLFCALLEHLLLLWRLQVLTRREVEACLAAVPTAAAAVTVGAPDGGRSETGGRPS
jgi:hypothetical protein